MTSGLGGAYIVAMPKTPKGFALLSREEHRRLASKGGKAAQATGRCHRYTPETGREAGKRSPSKFTPATATEAGRKGGLTVSRDAAHMAAIGRLGGAATARKAEAV